MKTTSRFFHVMLAVLPIVLMPDVRAVSPPPDGSYPRGNTAEGQNALLGLTSGQFNTAVGFLSLGSDNTNSFNTAIGAGALLANTADENTATGTGALLSNTTGSLNTANGVFALFSNTIGFENTAMGESALFRNTIGQENTAVGEDALFSNTEGSSNTAVGTGALSDSTTGHDNVAVGLGSVSHNGTGAHNVALGNFTIFNNSIGNDNTACGDSALFHNTTGSENTAVGEQALLHNDDAVNNTAVGFQALAANVSGGANTAVGFSALSGNTGDFNIALGNNAGASLTTGSANIDIGNGGVAGDDHTTRIGSVETRTFIAGIRGVSTGNNNAIPVLIDSAGQLGTASSSERFKKDVQPMDKASEAILSLKPVTFHYKSDKTKRPEFGLIAEQVADVSPDLVVRDQNSQIYTVRYDAVNAMLLNEFLKEHRRVQEQQAQIGELNSRITRQDRVIAQQQKEFEEKIAQRDNEIRALIAHVEKQSEQIQKVTAQIGMSEAGVRVAVGGR